MSELFTSDDQQRYLKLGEFMKRYLDSKDKVALYREYEFLLKSVRPIDLFNMPMFHDNTEYSVDEIKNYANRFVNLFYHGLVAFEWNKNESIVLESFIEENRMIMYQLESVKPFFENNTIEKSIPQILDFFERAEVIEKKFIKSQMILYPVLEKILPSKTPFKVLWSVEDDLLVARKNIIELLKSSTIHWPTLKIEIGQFYYQLAGLIQKEDIIVLPLASVYIDHATWNSMIKSLIDIGYAFMDTPDLKSKSLDKELADFQISTATGTLSLDQFNLVMSHLPIAITFVDEFDKVRYFNQTKERHFPRTAQTIGREVRYCHPEKSVHVVEKILQEFKSGKQSIAQFWMDFKGIKLLISYYAVRDSMGNYKGVIETTQDISNMKNYIGEKRLLDWE